MNSRNNKCTVDFSNAEKVINFRISLLSLLCSPRWIPLIPMISLLIISCSDIIHSIFKGGFIQSLSISFILLLIYSPFQWLIFYRRIPLLYKKDITLAIFKDRFVYIAGDVNVAIPRDGAKVFKGVLNTNIISYLNSHVLVNADAIAFEELKSYIK